ncbi:hypothetical protein F383_18159 [Gossypium arboreum]|uniref:Uncharacterized protein n=1 Tax=Gossypium arboreum TaxID=29729 RepID=A0A0B0NGB9_GOSAR|nr:hypothetical protein F383_18159 [Gossypium arboreum]
MHISSTNL